MKTICTLNGRIIMSQDGEALETMTANAAQYAGAVASVIPDEEYFDLMRAQLSQQNVERKDAVAEKIKRVFPGMTAAQQDFLIQLAERT